LVRAVIVIISGRYEIWEGAARTGEERFRFLGHAIESQRTMGRSEETREQLRIALDGARAPAEIELARQEGDTATQALYRIDRAGATLRAVVRPQTGASIERVVPYPEGAELDFPSPLITFLTVARLRLRPGERRDVDFVVMTMPTLLPATERRRFRRLPDIELKTAGGEPITAADYVVERVGGDALEHRFQSNLLGLPIRLWRQEGEGKREYRLVE
jgi:hypothetical protein